SRFGVRFEITRVLVRDTARDRGLPIDSQLFTNDLVAFLDGDADVVIEAVGGEEPARSIALSALRRGRKLITANKELIAAHGAWLDTLATQHSAAKLSIIGWIGFGIQPRALNIRRISLLPALERLVQFGVFLDGRVRLLAECTRLSNNTIVASVEPVLLPRS